MNPKMQNEQYFFGVMKCSKIRLWWWLHNLTYIIKTTELRNSLKWVNLMLFKLSLN